AEALHTGCVRRVADAPAVVAAVSDLEVAERVDVRPELHRPRHDLGHPVDAVLADRHRLVGVVRGRHERLAEVAAGEDWRLLVEDLAEVVDAALADEPERLEALR